MIHLRGWSKSSWKEAVDRDNIVLGTGNWETEASNRIRFKRRLRVVMDLKGLGKYERQGVHRITFSLSRIFMKVFNQALLKFQI